jgi:hypothetical protein
MDVAAFSSGQAPERGGQMIAEGSGATFAPFSRRRALFR